MVSVACDIIYIASEAYDWIVKEYALSYNLFFIKCNSFLIRGVHALLQEKRIQNLDSDTYTIHN